MKHLYLPNRIQRVQLSGEFSTWTALSGGMPKESWLGPISFIILIDDLAVGAILHKYVDDTTISEPLSSISQTSDIQSHVNSWLLWTSQNSMKLNYSNIKETLFGPPLKLNDPSIDIDHNLIERISGFKLMDTPISNNLSWNYW